MGGRHGGSTIRHRGITEGSEDGEGNRGEGSLRAQEMPANDDEQ